jgi:RNA polymerase sigma factor (TIGR02999 family)
LNFNPDHSFQKGQAMSQPGEITNLLQQADQGDRDAADRLFALVENDLKAIARKRKRAAPVGGEQSTTLLVDDMFVRLVGQQATSWRPGDRQKFFGYAANQIHQLLVKAAQAARAEKRGGGRQRVEAEAMDLAADPGRSESVDLLLDLKDALDRFERFAPEDALLFRVRYFLGCTFDECAEVLGVSATEAKRKFERARLWLESELKEYHIDA